MGLDAFVLTKARLAVMPATGGYGLIDDGVVAISDGRIRYAGAAAGLPAEFASWAPVDLGGRLVTPALIDCHTHLVYGGSRAREFERRLEGVTYEQIAREGVPPRSATPSGAR